MPRSSAGILRSPFIIRRRSRLDSPDEKRRADRGRELVQAERVHPEREDRAPVKRAVGQVKWGLGSYLYYTLISSKACSSARGRQPFRCDEAPRFLEQRLQLRQSNGGDVHAHRRIAPIVIRDEESPRVALQERLARVEVDLDGERLAVLAQAEEEPPGDSKG